MSDHVRIFPQELHYGFERTLERRLKAARVPNVAGIIRDVVPELIDQVPTAAYEAAAPMDRGIFFLHGEVTEESIVALQWELMSSHESVKANVPFTIYVSTIGGSEEAGFALMSTIHELQRDGRIVNVHVQGGAYSMGSIILQAGTKRSIESYAFLMIHDSAWSCVDPQKTPVHQDTVEFIRRMDLAVAEVFSARCGKPPAYYLKKWDRRDWYISAKEALEEGLVDFVVEPPTYRRFRQRKAAA